MTGSRVLGGAFLHIHRCQKAPPWTALRLHNKYIGSWMSMLAHSQMPKGTPRDCCRRLHNYRSCGISGQVSHIKVLVQYKRQLGKSCHVANAITRLSHVREALNLTAYRMQCLLSPCESGALSERCFMGSCPRLTVSRSLGPYIGIPPAILWAKFYW